MSVLYITTFKTSRKSSVPGLARTVGIKIDPSKQSVKLLVSGIDWNFQISIFEVDFSQPVTSFNQQCNDRAQIFHLEVLVNYKFVQRV